MGVILEAQIYTRQVGRIGSTKVMAARGDDSLYTAARGDVSWGADIHSGSVVMTAIGILV